MAVPSSLLNQTLVNPVGSVFVYSDLSMITMQVRAPPALYTHLQPLPMSLP